MSAFPHAITIWEAAGLCGALIYCFTYVLSALDCLPSQSPYYYIAKFAAAALVLVSLVTQFNLATLVIQLFFLAVSVFGFARHVGARRRARAYERSLSHASCLPTPTILTDGSIPPTNTRQPA